MAHSSAFRERIEQMEHTRHERLSLLQAEKELQVNKYQVLAMKLASIRATEQRCLVLDQKIALHNYKILALKSDVENLDAKYESALQDFRVLKIEVEELEEMEKEKGRFYESKGSEMKEFRESVDKFTVKCQTQVEGLKNRVNELKSTFMNFQGNNEYIKSFDIAAAEMRKSELQAMKANVERKLASNYQTRALLQKQLQNTLMRSQERRRSFPSTEVKKAN